MGTFGIVEGHPSSDHPPGVETVSDFFEIDGFLLHRAPKPLDEDVVEIATAPIHRDAHTSVGQDGAPGRPGELRSLDALLRVKRRFVSDLFLCAAA